VQAGALLLACAALAAGWELLARQAPGSPLYLGVLPGPIAALRELCFMLGTTLALAGALLAPSPSEPPFGARYTQLAIAGALTSVLAQLYAASQGMHAAQLHDTRPDALPLFVLRQGGAAACAIGLVPFGLRALRSASSRQSQP
jgi:hypothetical protein